MSAPAFVIVSIVPSCAHELLMLAIAEQLHVRSGFSCRFENVAVARRPETWLVTGMPT